MNRIKEALKNTRKTQAWMIGQPGKSYNVINSHNINLRQPGLERHNKITELLKVDEKSLTINNKLIIL